MTKIHPPSHRVAAFALIFNSNGAVLLSRRADSGWWNLPGGGVEAHESVSEGIIREVREETGLEVAVNRLVGVYSKPQKHEVVLTFECNVLGGELQTTEESAEHQWFAPESLPTEQFLPKHRERVLDALSNQPAAILREQRSASVGDHQPNHNQ
ncbi:NUDIX hydrolase [Herpetosiphon geysericola]|uniref:NUDIX hydrolase n=1 Tax=Herpetosiphon geysericola TaxID=70996 RepID=A0A0P6Y411_9CHLR|nr:NUDIX domain-containing protein [Herpetosiphon geysericola]KPL90739.1 NUDIX hydrolase [Herpetosiphon geysericola]